MCIKTETQTEPRMSEAQAEFRAERSTIYQINQDTTIQHFDCTNIPIWLRSMNHERQA